MNALVGTRTLWLASLRHDGRRFLPWVFLATLLPASSVLAYPAAFPDAASRQGLELAVKSNPALSLIFGPATDFGTADGFAVWRSLTVGGLLAGLGAIFAVVRCTRAQEDSGQAELLASGVVGRLARVCAGVAVGAACSLLVGLVAAVVTTAAGGNPATSFLLGATFTATGLLFTAVAVLAAQLGADAHTCTALAVGTLGALFLLRGALSTLEAPAWTVWLDPLGWVGETHPGDQNNPWPLLAVLALALAVLAVALVLQSRRDFGQGVLDPRPGPATGSIAGPFGLAARLSRTQLITWAIVALVLGVVLGYLAGSIRDLLGQDSMIQKILAAGATSQATLVSAFLVTILSILGLVLSIPGIWLLQRVRAEETSGRLETLLATPLSRLRYLGSQVALALLVSSVFLILGAALLAWLAASADVGADYWRTLGQAAAALPALWVVIGVAVAVVGALPRVTPLAWLGLLISFVLTLFGSTLNLPTWVLKLNPFEHVPTLGIQGLDGAGFGTLAGLTAVAALLVVLGLLGFRRRDIGS
ncbi:MAG: multidrug ABC transporter permease [Arthrobacter sp.]|nr:multidrug ABC transporter permease [Arthrobacter sp.]